MVIPGTPVQIRYALTPQGQELMAVLQPLIDWSRRRYGAAVSSG